MLSHTENTYFSFKSSLNENTYFSFKELLKVTSFALRGILNDALILVHSFIQVCIDLFGVFILSVLVVSYIVGDVIKEKRNSVMEKIPFKRSNVFKDFEAVFPYPFLVGFLSDLWEDVLKLSYACQCFFFWDLVFFPILIVIVGLWCAPMIVHALIKEGINSVEENRAFRWDNIYNDFDAWALPQLRTINRNMKAEQRSYLQKGLKPAK